MTPNISISIIIPCYNAAKYIKETLDSILQQTFKDFEVILIDDGSKDDTASIIQSYQDARIRFYQQANQGQCKASNYGLSLAQGKYIKFIDADDIINETHLQAQWEQINGATDVLASCAWGRFYDDNPNSAEFIPETVWKNMPSLEWIKASLSQRNDMMGAWVWLIPKELLDTTGGWDERLSLNNDFEFSMRLLTHVKEVRFAEEAKLFYRSGLATLSQTTSRKAFQSAILSNELGCSYLLHKEDTPETRSLCANRYQEWVFRIYPSNKDLVRQLERKIKVLGGSKRKIEGGKVLTTLASLLGWKAAKYIKTVMEQKGYKKMPFN